MQRGHIFWEYKKKKQHQSVDANAMKMHCSLHAIVKLL